MALKLTFLSITTEEHDRANFKDTDVKAEFLAAFQLADPVLFGLVDSAVEGMSPADFEIVYNSSIQSKGFSQSSVAKFPAVVYIKRLPSCDTPKRQSKKNETLRRVLQ